MTMLSTTGYWGGVSTSARPGSSRRDFLGTGMFAGLTAVMSGCGVGQPREIRMSESTTSRPKHSEGLLSFRPPPPGKSTGRRGLVALEEGTAPEPAYAYVPDTDDGQAPMRLVVFLHGAGGNGHRSVNILRSYADERRLLLLSPKSVGPTWDVILGGYGPDIANLDRLLTAVTARYPVRGCTLAGFSDGASYALSVGVSNGDVFDSVMAFSPGFSAAQVRSGKPRFFVSHGVHDETLPIDRCSRRLVPMLEKSGYDVTYEEFDGGHEVPDDIKRSAVGWLTGS